jgi:hypothetical protein
LVNLNRGQSLGFGKTPGDVFRFTIRDSLCSDNRHFDLKSLFQFRPISAHDAGKPRSGFRLMMTSSPGESPGQRHQKMAAVVFTLAIIVLHGSFLLHAGAFWRDEVNVINLAHAHSLSAMAQDSFPVLLPVLIKCWSAVGLAGTDFSLRILGVLSGLFLVAALWMACQATHRPAPLLSLALLGLNGTAIFWGDSLRAFGLGSALIVLTVASTCAVLEKPTWSRTFALSLAAILSVQALYQNAVFFAAIGIAGWMVCWQRKDKSAARKIFIAALASILSFLPYLEGIFRWQHATTIRPGFSSMAALDNLHTILAFPLPQIVWLWVLLALAVIGFGAMAFFKRGASPSQPNTPLTQPELQLFAGTTLLLSLAGYIAFLRFAALITSPWYFLPIMTVAATCFDLGVSLDVLPRLFRTIAWALLIGIAALSIPFGLRDLNCRVTNVDLVANYLDRNVSAQDYVVVTPWYLGISFDRYYHAGAKWDTLPPVADHSTHRFDLVPATTADEARADQPAFDRITAALQSGRHVWVAGWMRIPPPGRTASTVESRFLAKHSESFEPVDLKIKGQTSDYEDFSLLLASGWRTNAP